MAPIRKGKIGYRAYNSWTAAELHGVLQHYNMRVRASVRSRRHKMKLWDNLRRFVDEHQVEIADIQRIQSERGVGPMRPTCRTPSIRKLRLCRCYENNSESNANTPERTTATQEDAMEVDSQQQGELDLSELQEGNKYCTVCDDQLNTANCPSKLVTDHCEHQFDICLNCLAESLSAQSENKVWDQMTCPVCNSALNHEDMKTFATQDVFRRYDEFMLAEAMSNMPEFRRCPRPNCGAGQLHFQGAQQPIVTCTGCGYKTCFTHGGDWHAGYTCAQFDQEQARTRAQHDRENEESRMEIDRATEACPNCSRPIQKDGGCQHMTCTACDYQFCWDCSANWDDIIEGGNEYHALDCPWHSDNLPRYDSEDEQVAQLMDQEREQQRARRRAEQQRQQVHRQPQ